MLLRSTLATASLPYRAAVAWRNRAYDRGRREIIRVEVPVISVGNLTTGGTGKTPMVAYLARWYRSRGVRVSIVSRGYGRGDADENDEAAELHQRLPDVPHVQDPDRVQAASIAIDELDTQLILMDDGFQHRRLHRDLDIVLVDATCPFGYGHLLPRGMLREPIRNIARADVVVITRCNQVDAAQIESVLQTIRRVHHLVPVVQCSYRPSGVQEFAGPSQEVSVLANARVALISGVGNPKAFRCTVQSVGATVMAERVLPDHAAFDRETINQLEQWLETVPVIDYVVCTQKDLVKIRSDRLSKFPIVALTIDADICRNEAFESQLAELTPQLHSSDGAEQAS